MTKTRLVFMGTPAYAVPTLQALFDSKIYDIVGVYTQPDKKKGRGRQRQSCPVAAYAKANDLALYQPVKLNTDERYAELQALRPDIIVVIAYGKILRQRFLDIPRLGCVNLHASILPKYRGAAPIQWALLNGETETGVCLMQMDAGMDTGDVYACEKTAIAAEDSSETLFERLANMSAKILMTHLPSIITGNLDPQKQTGDATTAPMIRKELGYLQPTDDAVQIERKVRALNPWPSVSARFRNKKIQLISVSAIPKDDVEYTENLAVAGTLFTQQKRVFLVAGNATIVELLAVKIEGKSVVEASSLIHGYRLQNGEKITYLSTND